MGVDAEGGRAGQVVDDIVAHQATVVVVGVYVLVQESLDLGARTEMGALDLVAKAAEPLSRRHSRRLLATAIRAHL